MRRAGGRLGAGALVLALSAGVAGAQKAELRGFARTFQQNQEALRRYGWVSRIEVVVDGEVQSVERFRMRYGADGRLERTPLDDEGRKHAARKKSKKAAEKREELRELLQSYAHPARPDLFVRTTITDATQDGEALTRMQLRSVVHQGDTMEILMDRVSNRPRSFEVFTSLEGEPVQARVEFEPLENGPSYPARATIHTESRNKKVVIRVENSDYVLLGGTDDR